MVLFNGLGEISATWARITSEVSATTRVCAYDRAGQGWSDDTNSPQDGVAAARDLHALLAAAGEPGPYILAGHSTGGPYALTYAARYPQQVAGMVLLDSSSPEQMTSIPSYAGQYALALRRGLAFLPTLTRIGLGSLFSSGAGLPADAIGRAQAMTSTARAARNGRDEISMIPTVFRQAQALTSLHGRPLAVLTTSDSLGTDGWKAAQDKLAALSGNHVHRDVDSTHAGLITDERPAARVGARHRRGHRLGPNRLAAALTTRPPPTATLSRRSSDVPPRRTTRHPHRNPPGGARDRGSPGPCSPSPWPPRSWSCWTSPSSTPPCPRSEAPCI